MNAPRTAEVSPFTTFCEGPEDESKGFALFPAFYRRNYRRWLPADADASILVLSSGPGYFQDFLASEGYREVVGLDTDPGKVATARDRGHRSEEASPFEWLADGTRDEAFDLVFLEQEVNHLTRSELLELLRLCLDALRPGGRLVLNAANCANPLVGPEHPGNNWDHYLWTAEGNLTQILAWVGYTAVEAFPLDFYVLWKNPLNYVARVATGALHLSLRVAFRLYGKSGSIFTKRLGATGVKPRQPPR